MRPYRYEDAAMPIVAVILVTIPSDNVISRRRLITYVISVPMDSCTNNTFPGVPVLSFSSSHCCNAAMLVSMIFFASFQRRLNWLQHWRSSHQVLVSSCYSSMYLNQWCNTLLYALWQGALITNHSFTEPFSGLQQTAIHLLLLLLLMARTYFAI